MLPKKLRIQRKDLKSIKDRGFWFNSKNISLCLYKNSDNSGLSDSKFAFSCSKKVLKSAVKRNLLRRRGYSALSFYIKDIKKGFYFIFVFKKTEKIPSFDDIKTDLFELLQLAKMFK